MSSGGVVVAVVYSLGPPPPITHPPTMPTYTTRFFLARPTITNSALHVMPYLRPLQLYVMTRTLAVRAIRLCRPINHTRGWCGMIICCCLGYCHTPFTTPRHDTGIRAWTARTRRCRVDRSDAFQYLIIMLYWYYIYLANAFWNKSIFFFF